MNRSALARRWLATGILALLAGGALALIVTGAKVPALAEWATRRLYFVRWCLVVHVNLANLVWFTAIPIGLIQLALARISPAASRLDVAAWCGAVAGVVLMAATLPSLGATPVLSNYLPVLHHPLFLAGFGLYLVAAAWPHAAHVFDIEGLADRPQLGVAPTAGAAALENSRFGLWVGSAFFLAAPAALFFSWRGTAPIGLLSAPIYYDILFWGPGHLLQHANVCFLVAAWVALLSRDGAPPVFRRAELFLPFAGLGLPLLALPWLFGQAPATDAYRNAFTHLMRWGMAPPMAFFLWRAWRKRGDWRPGLCPAARASLGFSILLAVLGVLFGSLIRGQDLRIPGHYHATIGAITLAFMGISHRLARSGGGGAGGRVMTASALLYGLGQVLFSGGLFVAGTFGLGRKTYGEEQAITHGAQHIGLSVIALGGVLALLGGMLFAVAMLAPRGARAENLQND